MSQHFVIIGAGPCGLFAALTGLDLGHTVTIVEAAPMPGGLAAGSSFGGNHYDLGVHMLHSFDANVFAKCASSMGSKRIEVPLNAHIVWRGKTYHYPLRGRDILAGFAPLTLARCLLGLAHAELKSRFSPHQGSTAEDALIELYGVPLYELFFEDFTAKYWGLHPRSLSAEFVRRKMPRLSAVDVFKNALQKLGLGRINRDSVEGALRFETLHYSEHGCRTLPESLAATIEQRGGTIIYDSPVDVVTTDGRSQVTSITTADGRTISGDKFVSTAPINHLIKSLSPAAPRSAISAARSLRHRPLIVYGLLVDRPKSMDALYTYYRDRSFHRVGEPKNAGLAVTPPDHTILIVEKTCTHDELGQHRDSDQLPEEIVADLEALSLCAREEIVSVHVQTAPQAYPVFDLHFDAALKVVQDHLASFGNLISTGRQGAFTYPNMHTAMRMGADAVQTLSS